MLNSSITEGCEVYGTVKNSVLGPNVKIMKGASVCDCVIMANVVIGEGATVEYSIIDSNVNVGRNAVVGKEKDCASGITIVGTGLDIPDGHRIADGEMVTEI